MVNLSLKSILEEYGKNVNISIFNGEVTIPSDKRIYSFLSAKYDILAKKADKNFYDALLKLGDWKRTEEIQPLFMRYAEGIAKEMVSDAISIGFYGLDLDTAIRMCEEDGCFEQIYNLIMDFVQQCSDIGAAVKSSNAQREEAKENRTRLEVYTSSDNIGTVIKNQLKVDAVNAAIGWLYNTSNKKAHQAEQQAAIKKIESLYGNMIINMRLAVFPAYKRMFNILIMMLRNADSSIVSFPVYENDSIARNIFNNLTTQQLNDEQKFEMARQIIGLAPYDISYFAELYRLFPNYKTEVFNAAKQCGHDISEMICNDETEIIKSMLSNESASVINALNYIQKMISEMSFSDATVNQFISVIDEQSRSNISRTFESKFNNANSIDKINNAKTEFNNYLNEYDIIPFNNTIRFLEEHDIHVKIDNKKQFYNSFSDKEEEYYFNVIKADAINIIKNDPSGYEAAFAYIKEKADLIGLNHKYRNLAEKEINDTLKKIVFDFIESNGLNTIDETENCLEKFRNYADSINLNNEIRKSAEEKIFQHINDFIVSKISELNDGSYNGVVQSEKLVSEYAQKYGSDISKKELDNICKEYRNISGITVDTNEEASEIKDFLRNNPDVSDNNYSFNNREDILTAKNKLTEFMSNYCYNAITAKYTEQINEKLKKFDIENAENLLNNPPTLIYHSDYEEYIMLIQELPLDKSRTEPVASQWETKLKTFESDCEQAQIYNKFKANNNVFWWFNSVDIIMSIIVCLVIFAAFKIGGIVIGGFVLFIGGSVIIDAYKNDIKKWKAITHDGKYKLEDIARVKYPDRVKAKILESPNNNGNNTTAKKK